MSTADQQAPLSVTLREIQEILNTFQRSSWTSLRLEIAGMRITADKNGVPQAEEAAPAAPAAASAEPPAARTSSGGPPPVPAARSPEPAPAPDGPQPPATQAGPAGPSRGAAAPSEEGLVEVKSPAVGTFWVAPSPGAPPFVEIGQTVSAGQQLAIVEVMKLMNPVFSPCAGEVVAALARNADLVEFDQVLFLIRPADE